MIDKDKLDKGDPNYLFIFQMGEYTPLNLNFEIFLDRIYSPMGKLFGNGVTILQKIIIEQDSAMYKTVR